MSTQDVAQAEEEAIRLFTIADEQNQVNSVIPIRWCISRHVARLIQDRKIEDPQLLLVTTKDGNEVDRHVVPLYDMMRYVQFRSPGANVLHAAIVWRRMNEYSAKDALTARFDDGRFKAEVISRKNPYERISEVQDERDEARDEQEKAHLQAQLSQLWAERADKSDEVEETLIRNNFDGVNCLNYEGQLEVVVPEGMFAPKPPAWMQWLGTRYTFWNAAPRDQCDLRRRALFTGVTLPFAMIGIAIAVAIAVAFGAMLVTLNVLTMIALLIGGMRGLRLDMVTPSGNPEDILDESGPSIWYKKKVMGDHGVVYEDRTPVWFVLNPATIVGAVVVGSGVGTLLWSSTLTGIYVCLGILGIITLIVALVASGPAKRRIAERRARRKQQQGDLERERKEALRQDLELLACGQQSSEVSINALPKRRRTVTLRFQAFKADHCKPFAR